MLNYNAKIILIDNFIFRLKQLITLRKIKKNKFIYTFKQIIFNKCKNLRKINNNIFALLINDIAYKSFSFIRLYIQTLLIINILVGFILVIILNRYFRIKVIHKICIIVMTLMKTYHKTFKTYRL